MLRGFRWQLLAFLVAIALFGISLIVRFVTADPVANLTLPARTDATMTPESSPIPIAGSLTPLPPASGPEIATYREGLVGTIQRLNPLLAALNPVDGDLISLIFEGLTRIDQYGEATPALAQEWVVSSDGLEYVMVLRDDVLWQDGLPFTAADVVYTMSLLSSPDFPGSTELGAFWRTVETEQIDDHLVRFRLAQPLATFPEALRIGILPYHALQGTTASQLAAHPFNLSPIGTGPYQLEAMRAEGNQIRQVDLRVAPVYRQRPEGATGYTLERLSFYLYDSFDAVFVALQNGEIDGYAAQNGGERLSLLTLPGNLAIYTTYEPAIGMLIFNWANDNFPVFREQRVRQALVRGLDRTSLIERHLSNVATQADSPFLPLSWAYHYGSADIVWPSYDLAAARELLATARIDTGETEDSNASPAATLFSFSILTIDNPALVNMAQEIATQWMQLNLDVHVEAVDAAIYQTRLTTTQFDVALVELSSLGSADPDMYSFWHQGQYPDGQNYGGANDRAISEALERARRDGNGIHRNLYYLDFQRAFIERAIAIPLYYPLYTYAISSRVSGVQVGFIGAPSDRFMTIKDWAISR